jgi:zeaxanthin glucosyltransferase
MSELWVRAGMPGTQAPDLRFSPHLVIAFTAAALTGELSLPDHFALVGPALAGRPPGPDFPWDWLDPQRRHVLVTVGTMAENNATDSTNFYARAAAALEPLGDTVQGIMIAPPGALPEQPEHIMVTPRVPLLELMPRLDVVVCHGGLNTVSESLSFGIPLVVAPLTRDQPINAAAVVAAGAGLRVRFALVKPDQLRDAMLTVLGDPRFRLAAGRVRDSFAAAGGAAAAAQRLERLPVTPRRAATVGEHS